MFAQRRVLVTSVIAMKFDSCDRSEPEGCPERTELKGKTSREAMRVRKVVVFVAWTWSVGGVAGAGEAGRDLIFRLGVLGFN